MSNINYGRVLIGGVVAGVVLLVFDLLSMNVLGIDMDAWAAEHSLQMPPVWTWVILDVLFGVMIVWLYAAIRPRFGAGVRTAGITAAWVWLFFTLVYGGLAAMGLYTQADFVKLAAWGVLTVAAATYAGAWLYREGAGAAV